MSTYPGRRRGPAGFAGARARQMPAEYHEGTCEDFLRRHEQEAEAAAGGPARERQQFAQCLFHRAADTRNTRLAIEHVANHGGPAPGPNGLRLRDLDDHERWSLARALSRSLTDSTYRMGSIRTVHVPKGRNRGTRPIRLLNMEDRVAQRAILQVVQPFTDPGLGPLAFGGRPGRSREDALAKAKQLASANNGWIWIVEDAKDAFERVPHGRLLDVVRRWLPSEELISLISRAVLGNRNKGLMQGGGLSPLLLDLLLNQSVDRRWSLRFPDTPLIRSVDDFLMICPNEAVARERYDRLTDRLRGAGMALKGSPDGNIVDLRAGRRLTWLGYDIGIDSNDHLDVRLSTRAWESLEDSLFVAQEESEAPLVAWRTALDWVSQQGATYGSEDVGCVYARIARCYEEAGFSELPCREQVDAVWRKGHFRWMRKYRESLLSLRRGSAAGSAPQHGIYAAESGRDGRMAREGLLPRFSPRNRELRLYCDSPKRRGDRLADEPARSHGPGFPRHLLSYRRSS